MAFLAGIGFKDPKEIFVEIFERHVVSLAKHGIKFLEGHICALSH